MLIWSDEAGGGERPTSERRTHLPLAFLGWRIWLRCAHANARAGAPGQEVVPAQGCCARSGPNFSRAGRVRRAHGLRAANLTQRSTWIEFQVCPPISGAPRPVQLQAPFPSRLLLLSFHFAGGGQWNLAGVLSWWQSTSHPDYGIASCGLLSKVRVCVGCRVVAQDRVRGPNNRRATSPPFRALARRPAHPE